MMQYLKALAALSAAFLCGPATLAAPAATPAPAASEGFPPEDYRYQPPARFRQDEAFTVVFMSGREVDKIAKSIMSIPDGTVVGFTTGSGSKQIVVLTDPCEWRPLDKYAIDACFATLGTERDFFKFIALPRSETHEFCEGAEICLIGDIMVGSRTSTNLSYGRLVGHEVGHVSGWPGSHPTS